VIRKQLTQSLQPLLVLYLGSLATTTLRRNLSAVENNATDFRFCCELLVVLPADAPLHGDRQGLRTLEARLSAHASVRLLLRTPEGLAQELSTGRHPRISLHSHAIVLYERDHTLEQIVQQVQAAADAAKARRSAGLHRSARDEGGEARSDAGAPGPDAGLLPVGLSAEERADPLSVVRSFYRAYDLPEVRSRIGMWLQAVVSSPSWPVAETGLHLDFYLSVCRLLTSGWLLRGCAPPAWVTQELAGPSGAGMPPQRLYCPHEGADAWAYFPAHLSRVEFGSPGQVLAGLFTDRPLSWWLTELYDLFSYSLTDGTPAEAGEERDLAATGHQLHRLAEACHLLAVWARRAGEQPSAAGQLSAAVAAQPIPVASVL